MKKVHHFYINIVITNNIIFDKGAQYHIDKLKSIVEKINGWESKIKDLPSENFASKTAEFKSKVQNGAKLDDLIPETFAYVREASRRTLGERHFDVQLMGGVILHQ